MSHDNRSDIPAAEAGMSFGKKLDGDRERSGELTIKDLLSYRLYKTHIILARGAAVRYRNEFNVSLSEWRVLALLVALGPMSLNQLAREADLDKGQMSRVVSGLVARALIGREPGKNRERSALVLTPAGKKLYRQLIKAAGERNAAFRACLSPEELATLESALVRLETLGRALGAAAATPPAQGGKKTGKEPTRATPDDPAAPAVASPRE
jgi:DNA-binding MarR family transcriptional regulator